MNRKIFLCQFLLSDIAILSYLASIQLVLFLLIHQHYGFFRDELYYIACSDHLASGYVDHPPLSVFILACARLFLGDSLFAVRLLPAVAGALLVFLTGLIARQLGGKRFAQILAALTIMVAPAYLGMNHKFTMNPFDYLFWLLSVYIVILIIKRKNPKIWLLLGLVAGLGLMNKYSIFFLAFGLIGGLLLTSNRKYMLNKWFWLAGLTALLIFLPHIIWQIQHDFPTLEFMRNVKLYKNYQASLVEILTGQMIFLNFVNVFFVLAGLYYCLFHKNGKLYRFLGWTSFIIILVMITLKAKVYYFSPIYPMILASGSVAIEKFICSKKWNYLKPAFVSILIISGIIAAPFAMPVLPVETFVKYQDLLGFTPPREERSEIGMLPQHFADMFGWENMVATVAKVYQDLSLEDQSKCVIYVRNYGEAGAIDFFGKKYNLPRATCAHNNYWLWGPPRDKTGEVVIIFGIANDLQRSLEDLSQLFEKVEHADTIKCKYCMPYENNRPVFICRKMKTSFQEIWPGERIYR